MISGYELLSESDKLELEVLMLFFMFVNVTIAVFAVSPYSNIFSYNYSNQIKLELKN